MPTYKQVETAAITMTVAPLVIYLTAGSLGISLHLMSNAEVDHLFGAVKLVMAFSGGVGIGAWLTMRPGDY